MFHVSNLLLLLLALFMCRFECSDLAMMLIICVESGCFPEAGQVLLPQGPPFGQEGEPALVRQHWSGHQDPRCCHQRQVRGQEVPFHLRCDHSWSHPEGTCHFH